MGGQSGRFDKGRTMSVCEGPMVGGYQSRN